MNDDDQGGKTTPWRVATVRGEPYEVGGYKLTPVVRVLTYAVGRGTLRARSISGWGGGMVYARPLAIIAERDGQKRRIRLARATTGALNGMLAAGVSITLLLWAVRRFARRGRRRP